MGSLAKMRSGGGHPITAIADTQIINNFVYHTWSIRLERKYIYRRVYLGHIALHGAVGCAGGSEHYQIIYFTAKTSNSLHRQQSDNV